ncbi:MAG: hypothetical protein V3V78_05155 [Candidatus Woesearchaeota archaeon]
MLEKMRCRRTTLVGKRCRNAAVIRGLCMNHFQKEVKDETFQISQALGKNQSGA